MEPLVGASRLVRGRAVVNVGPARLVSLENALEFGLRLLENGLVAFGTEGALIEHQAAFALCRDSCPALQADRVLAGQEGRNVARGARPHDVVARVAPLGKEHELGFVSK